MAKLSEYPVAQQEEFTALESIYGDDFHQVAGSKTAWQSRPNLAFEIRVRALNNRDISVFLLIELPPEWPKVAPSIKIKEVEATNPNVQIKAQKILSNVQNESTLWDLFSDIQDIMEDAAESRARRKYVPTLEEERMKSEMEANRQAEERLQQQLREQQERELREKADTSRQVQALQRAQQRQEQQKGALSSSSNGEAYKHSITVPAPVKFDQPMDVSDRKGDRIRFDTVWGTFVLLKTDEKTVTLVTPLGDNNSQLPPLILKKIHLSERDVSGGSELGEIMREVEELLEDSKRHKHQNIIDFIGYKVQPTTARSNDDTFTIWELSILTEFANKGTLSELLDIAGGLDADKIRSWTTALLDALAFFDEHGYVHPAVHIGNVMLFLTPDGKTSVKLADGYGTTLRKLVLQARISKHIQEPPKSALWLAPELSLTQPARSNKTCIWDLCVIMIHMIAGKSVMSQYTSPREFLDRNDLTQHLEDMLLRMSEPDQSQRLRASELLNSGFLTEKGDIRESRSPAEPATPFSRRKVDKQVIQQGEASLWSTKWEDHGLLGKGGFGQVVKARYIMDKQYYAVKRIRCKDQDELEEMLREIQLLSKLNHPRIVRYYSTWVEKERQWVEESESYDESAIQSVINVKSTGYDYLSAKRYPGMQFDNSSDDNVEFGYDSDDQGSGQKFWQSPRKATGTEDSDRVGRSISLGWESQDKVAAYELRKQSSLIEPQILYIQMELCERLSLKDLLFRKLLTDQDEIWKLFRQIVEGLLYIHGKGVIHRDLKPDNIFLDESNNIRIGDFGLATRGRIPSINGKEPAPLIASDVTRSIGTALYVAPELQTGGTGAYSTKVDMYSLGIVFCEMCNPFNTRQEREEVLKRIRFDRAQLPLRMRHEEWHGQANIIYNLLNHDQNERPSAEQLLLQDSRLIPNYAEEEATEKYIASVAREEKREDFARLMSHFFGLGVPDAQNIAWDLTEVSTANPTHGSTATFVNSRLRSIFGRHCAIETSRQGLLPKSEYYDVAATFLDASGIEVQLPYDMTMPFARLLACSLPRNVRNYSFGDVYRKGPTGRQPSKYSEVAFDIVSYDANDLGLKEAEVLKVLDEIVCAFPSLRSKKSIVILLSHGDLLNSVLNFCHIKENQQAQVKKVLTELSVNQNTWRSIEAALRRTNVSVGNFIIQQLALFNFQDTLDGTIQRLEKIMVGTSYVADVQKPLTRLKEVMDYLSRFKLRTKVLISPLSNNAEEFYRGSTMFQCVDINQKQLIAVGGRYDALIKNIHSRLVETPARAVGLRLNSADLIERVEVDMKSADMTTSKAVSKSRRSDVLVTGHDPKLLTPECLDILNDLWNSEMCAELAEVPTSLNGFTSVDPIDENRLVVVVRPDSNAVDGMSIKVRNLGRKNETEVRRTELPAWLTAEANDKSHSESDQARNKLRREISVGEPISISIAEVRDPEVVFFTSQYKSKKTNRQNIKEDALLVTQRMTQSFLGDGPIAVVETTNDALEGIRNARLASPESWRAFIQSVSAQESSYWKDVQRRLQAWADDGKRGAWIYNQKTRGCIYYDFGKTL